MTELDGKFVVVMDHLADRHGPEVLPVSAVGDTRAEVKEVGQYDGGPPTLVPRDAYGAVHLGTTRLVDVRTGDELAATLYRLTASDG